MKQNITLTRARTHKLRLRLDGPDGKPYVMQPSEKLIFGVKKALTDSTYVFSKTIEYNHDGIFEQVQQVEPGEQPPQWKPNTYYSRSGSEGNYTYTLTESEPPRWATQYGDNGTWIYTNYYTHTGLYPINIDPQDTESLVHSSSYFYDVGLQNGAAYYSIVNTSKLYLEGNVTSREVQQNE